MASKQKVDIVDSITKSIKENSNFALIKFEKTTHQTLEELRRELRKSESTLTVIKNTLFEKAINKLSQTDKDFGEMSKKAFPLKDKSALLVLHGDWIEGLKEYFGKVKDNENFSFKVGYIDNQVYGDTDLMKLAQLPGKDELRAKIIGAMKNPMVRTTRALSFNMQKLVYILSQKAQQS
jgi:large subunit ribosomal protein L10